MRNDEFRKRIECIIEVNGKKVEQVKEFEEDIKRRVGKGKCHELGCKWIKVQSVRMCKDTNESI